MEERMNLAEAFSALAGYGAAVWCGVAAAIATFVIEIILCKKGILFASGEKKIARAKRRGHMLTAVRTNIRFRDREPEDATTNRLYIANYEYIVDGKVHTKQGGFQQPETPFNDYFVLRQFSKQGVLGI